jgi:hypothetical protein
MLRSMDIPAINPSFYASAEGGPYAAATFAMSLF